VAFEPTRAELRRVARFPQQAASGSVATHAAFDVAELPRRARSAVARALIYADRLKASAATETGIELPAVHSPSRAVGAPIARHRFGDAA
jgi:hypothetical protein